MGKDKAFLEVVGKPLFERVLDAFRESFERIVLVGDREERFAKYGLPVVPDLYPGSALGGLYTGLKLAATENVFVSSCDLPFPNAAIIRRLCSLAHGYDAVVPLTPYGFEPLFALYGKPCLGPMLDLLEQQNFCVYDFYPQVRVRYVSGEELADLDREGKAFLNVNTPEELEKVRKGASS
jgi:molybdopterin-guanine dinucleotide biosynthesis protein A